MEKNCVQHSDAPAVAACKVCEKSLCLMCTTEVGGDIFCSPKCADVYSEVKDWIEPKARPEEWNPLADPSGSGTEAVLPHDDSALDLERMVKPEESQPAPPLPEDESLLDMARVRAEFPVAKPDEWNPLADASSPAPAAELPQDESLLDMTRVPAPPQPPSSLEAPPVPAAPATETMCAQHADAKAVGACTKCSRPYCGGCAVDTSWGTFCTVECSVGFQAPGARPPSRTLPVLLGVAAAALIVIGFVVLFSGEKQKPPDNTLAVKPNPEPAKPEPAKPEPAKPEPAKPEPVKPEPAKPEPAKPEPVKPEPTKPEPAKPEPAKPEPAKPEPVKPPVKPEPPKPPAYRILARDPWMNEKAGAWFRFRTTTDAGEDYADVGLLERGAGFVVIASNSRKGEKTEPVREERFEVVDLSLVRIERLMRHGVTHDFEVLEPRGQGAWKWVVTDGRAAGAALPEEWVAKKIEPSRFGEQSLTVKGRTYECLIVEAGDRVWLSPTCPVGEVRRESDGSVRELVDFGDDWSKRPPFPEVRAPIAKVEPPKPEPAKPEPAKPEPAKPEPVKPEPAKPEPAKPEPAKPEPAKPEPAKPEPAKPEPVKPEPAKPEPAKPEPPKPELVKPEPKVDPAIRVKQSIDQASALIREATPLFTEVADGLETASPDRPQLEKLLEKVDEVRRRLKEARRLYAEIRADSNDPVMIENRIKKLDSLLDTTAGCVDQIKSKL